MLSCCAKVRQVAPRSGVRQVESGAPRCDHRFAVYAVLKHTRILMSRSMRWILQRLATCALPASSFAGRGGNVRQVDYT
jgi:hypothetical protein